MKLSKKELMSKFPQLEKFENQKWICEESIKHDCNYKEIPLKVSFELIKELISFLESQKFSNNWELCFSVKSRLKQLESLLSYFCRDTLVEETLKGNNLNQ